MTTSLPPLLLRPCCCSIRTRWQRANYNLDHGICHRRAHHAPLGLPRRAVWLFGERRSAGMPASSPILFSAGPPGGPHRLQNLPTCLHSTPRSEVASVREAIRIRRVRHKANRQRPIAQLHAMSSFPKLFRAIPSRGSLSTLPAAAFDGAACSPSAVRSAGEPSRGHSHHRLPKSTNLGQPL